ncbi:DUF5713 family protein [Moritella viscosa]|uniref:Uncharacterized protein n=1 Tax=Moritella viscosa TaxID=80854 RepID=A0ABY1HIB5_9GAMM|nr:DUF5713 family protein [Moritella viscosa]SGZ00656.1 Putative uncharacterized protein [Moritella viscosa]SGZ16255.1 Putative uncharacterized protein [Moritella viscosa]SHO28667.1 Putative uncharacterized protein [Moritella viscosa]
MNNDTMKNYKFLEEMYSDGYFPDFLVDKIKLILIELCENIESEKPQNNEALLILTHAATDKINDLEDEFEDNESELETGARESMADSFEYIVKAYGFSDVDIENVIATRDW